MFKALFKKQMMEINTWLIQSKKSGKKRTKSSAIIFGVLYAFLIISISSMFWFAAVMLCEPLVTAGSDWLYFSIMGLIAIALGVFGGVFSTYASLYKAKDNELLFSLPIKPSYILAVRLLGVWFWSFIFESTVLIPTILVYFIKAKPSVFTGAMDVLLLFLISVFILSLSCILGWAVAKISVKLKNRSYATVAVSLAFIALYYWAYAKAYSALQNISAYAQTVGEKIKGFAYPAYLMGRMGEGDIISCVIVVFAVIAFFALTLFIMSRSFIKTATAGTGSGKAEYKEKNIKTRTYDNALVFKELKHFTSSSVYMLNCGMGTVILPVLGVFLLIRREWAISMLQEVGIQLRDMPLVAGAAICLMATMNDITAPSVSLEGKNLWLLQSLPISAWQVLKSKLRLHLTITELPVVICSICMAIAFDLNLAETVSVMILSCIFVFLYALFGLFMNLKMPNLKWTDETVPVKQSFGIMITMFGGWGVIAALAGIYIAARSIIPNMLYLIVCIAFLTMIALAFLRWIKTKGAKILETL